TIRGGEQGWYTKLAANIPLVEDKLAARLSVYRQDRGGYVDNLNYGSRDVNGSESEGARLLLGLTPNDDITFTITALTQESTQDGVGAWSQEYGSRDYRSRNVSIAPFSDELDLFNATFQWQLGFAELTVTSSYYRWDVARVVDPNRPLSNLVNNTAAHANQCRPYFSQATPCNNDQLAQYQGYVQSLLPLSWYQRLGVKSRNHEVRLTSSGEGPLHWTVGVYHENRDDYHHHNIVNLDPLTGELQPWNITGASYAGNDLEQTAFFGELSYRLFDKLTLTAGTRRYDYDKITFGGVTQNNYLVSIFTRPRSEVDSGASGWVSKYNMSYEVTPDILTYVQASQGFRPGGANNVAGLTSELIAYKPDSLWSYEGGVKTLWADGRFTLNAALFRI